MVVKVYISGISGNKEVKKRQQRVLMILDSKNIKYEIIDITEPGREDDKDFMQNNSKCNGGTVSDPNPRTPLPPQVFNDDEYCGDYDQFDLANEVDTLEQFLKVEPPSEEPFADSKINAVNGVLQTEDEKESKEKAEEESTTEATETSNEVKENVTDNGEVESAETKEASVDREKSPPKETPAEEATPTENAEESKESENESKEVVEEKETEKEAVENGAVSSREQSEEKEATEPKNLSEALIQSEQIASAD